MDFLVNAITARIGIPYRCGDRYPVVALVAIPSYPSRDDAMNDGCDGEDNHGDINSENRIVFLVVCADMHFSRHVRLHGGMARRQA